MCSFIYLMCVYIVLKLPLLTRKQSSELQGWVNKPQWKLLYVATEHGFAATEFHARCDNQSATVTLVQVHGADFIIGGFTSQPWQSSASKSYTRDDTAFIFTFSKTKQIARRHAVKPGHEIKAIGVCRVVASHEKKS